MKVAIVSSAYHPYYTGGGEYSVKHLAEGLIKKGIEVFVITAYHEEITEQINGVQVYRVKYPNIYWSFESEQQPAYRKLIWHAIEGYNLKVENRIKGILIKEKPDVLHVRNAQDFSPYTCKVAKSLGIRVVVTTNNCTWLCPKSTMYRNGKNCSGQCIGCKLITYPKKYLSRYVDAVVGVSRFMTNIHAQYHYFPNASRKVIYTSAESKFTTLPILENGYVTFGFIGRVHPIKGVAEIIEAFRSVHQTQCKLLIAGGGPQDYYEQCQKMAEGINNITFLGESKPDDFYKKVDVVIINSLVNDAFPRVLVEAYADGRPVIASNTGGTPEMVSHGCTGYIFDPHKTHQLAKAMQKFTQINKQELLQMQENVRDFVSENFQDDVQQYAWVYNEVQNLGGNLN